MIMKRKDFEPKIKTGKNRNVELGQMLFGNKFDEFDAPDFVTAGFLLLEHEIGRVEWNRRQEIFESPLGGGCEDYKNKVFEIHSYYWNENPRLKLRPNFKCGSFEVRWYKHMGRGMTMNQDIDANKFFAILGKYMKYLDSIDSINYHRKYNIPKKKASRAKGVSD